MPEAVAAVPLWAYFGGLMGVITVSVQSFVTPRMPAFQLTLILFVGQVFMGLVLDALSGAGGSAQEWIGGVFAVAGLSLNALLDSLLRESCILQRSRSKNRAPFFEHEPAMRNRFRT